MSRKREEQRDKKRELARQMGVAGKEVPSKLLENERVTEPRLKASLEVLRIKRGLFKRAQPATLVVGLYLKDPGGTRFLGLLRAPCTLEKGSVSLPKVDDGLVEQVRYRRPGSFILVAALVESADDDVHDALVAALEGAVTTDCLIGAAGPATVASFASSTTSTSVQLQLEGADGLLAVAVVSVPAADRVKQVFALPLKSADDRLAATVDVDARL